VKFSHKKAQKAQSKTLLMIDFFCAFLWLSALSASFACKRFI